MFFFPLDWKILRRVNWWLGYAGGFSVLYVAGVCGALSEHRPHTALDMVQTVLNGMGILAVWGLGFRRAIITQTHLRQLRAC